MAIKMTKNINRQFTKEQFKVPERYKNLNFIQITKVKTQVD